jgi:uncharacterized peroxidase-related enzyme
VEDIVPRIEPLPIETMPEVRDIADATQARLGFIANSMRILSYRPGIARAFTELARAVNGADTTLDKPLRSMIAQVASRTAGCSYCMAHTAHSGLKAGISDEKEHALWEYETSPLFNAAERAALRVAQLAAMVPNQVSDADFAGLKKHFRDEQIVDIVAVISFYGFLNRWNDTMATELEASPLETGRRILTERGWSPGKHGPAGGSSAG